MVPTMQLLLPVILSAVGVFVASSLIHMVLRWHNSDYLKFSNEDEVRAAVRKGNPGPGVYPVPYCLGMKEMQSPEMQQKFKEGPIGMLLLRRIGPPSMGPALVAWFALTVAVAAIAGILGQASLPVGATFGRVLYLTGLVTFIAYAGGSISNGIWLGEPSRSVVKNVADAAIYGLAGGLVFALLWPG